MLFHLIGALSEFGKLGLTAIANSPARWTSSTPTRSRCSTARRQLGREKPLLKGLPAEPFVVGQLETYKLSHDHVRIDGVAYSAPFGLIGKPVDVHCTASLIGIFHQGERVASHPRSRQGARPAASGRSA